jgi:GH24 family phage-related lysozyme (muramidase)
VNANPNDPDIERQFKRWIYCKGEILPGLVKRREREANIYFGRPWK